MHLIIYDKNYMARRQILSLSERESLLALPDDELTLTRMAYFSEHDLALISAHRKPASRFGFAVLLCYLKNVGFAPDKKIPPSDALLKHIANRLKLTGDLWPAYLSGRETTRREHLTELYRCLCSTGSAIRHFVGGYKAGLNKGEARNALAHAVFLHRLGEIRDRKPENQSYRASGLTLLTAAISLWNTVYMERAVDALKRKGVKINEQLLSHLSPLGWEYINLTGDYIWKNNRIPVSGKFRRLRPAKLERSKINLNVQ